MSDVKFSFKDKKFQDDPEAQKWLSQCEREVNSELDRIYLDIVTFGHASSFTGKADAERRHKKTL